MNQSYRSTYFGTARVPSLPASTQRAAARAFGGRHAPVILTPAGLTWLNGTVEAMPPRGDLVEILTPEQALDFIEADAQVEMPHEVVVTVRRRSPRRGVVSVHAVIDLAIARRPAQSLAQRRAEVQADGAWAALLAAE